MLPGHLLLHFISVHANRVRAHVRASMCTHVRLHVRTRACTCMFVHTRVGGLYVPSTEASWGTGSLSP